MKKLVMGCFAAFMAAMTVQATTRYVDYTNGVDTNDGSAATPWKTIVHAITTAVENDEIVLAKGTHVCSANLVIDKKIHLHGAGENWETVFDANHALKGGNNSSHLKITSDGALVNNITFYHLCCGPYDYNSVIVSGDSVISNCVFTGSGCGSKATGCKSTGSSNHTLLKMQNGELTSCWITNNVYGRAPLVVIAGGNTEAKCSNCILAENRFPNSYCQDNDAGVLAVRTGKSIVRNCTVANNCLYANTGSPFQSGLSIRNYSSTVQDAPKIYNTIVWGNTNTAGAVRNVFALNDATYSKKDAAHMTNFVSNATTSPIKVSGSEYALNTTQTVSYAKYIIGCENVTDAPAFDANYALLTASANVVKFGAKQGTDAGGVDYCTSCDISGVPRGDKPSMGAVQYIAQGGLTVTVKASATEARLPEKISLKCETEGEQGTLSYKWDFNNDGTIDSTDATPTLSTIGEYSELKVIVTDSATSQSAFYDGTLTILPRYLTNIVVTADKTVVRAPGTITFSASVGDAEATGSYTYSWDLDGDGVEDSTAEHPVLSAVGKYVNPTLLKVTDVNTGLYSDKTACAGTYTILPAEPQTITVNLGDSVATAIASAYDGDTVLLKKGTHTCTANVVIDRPIILCGEGENGETILDANHKIASASSPHVTITADGALVKNLTFYRLCAGGYHSRLFVVSGESTVSNCVFTSCGWNDNDNSRLIDMVRGTLTSSWVTNNLCRYAPMVLLEGAYAVRCENCVFANNRIVTQHSHNNDAGILAAQTGNVLVRNCTVANNCLYASQGSPFQSGLSIRAYSDKVLDAPKIYNTIVWGNTNTAGVVRNVFAMADSNVKADRSHTTNFISNVTTSPIKVSSDEYALNTTQTVSYATYIIGCENVSDDPALNATYGLVPGSAKVIKFGAKQGTDAGGVDYCAAADIYGVARGGKPSMGAVQYVESSVLSVKIVPSATTARLPETIVLSAIVEGAASEDIAYAWDIDGDGAFDDGTDPTNVLDQVGTYSAVRVKVDDGSATAEAAYDGTLTILEELLDASVVSNGKIVRSPDKLVFSVEIANAYEGPLTYSWDTDGDGVEDWTGATVEYSADGIYHAPTLLSIRDKNGKYQKNVQLAGTFNRHPAGAATYYVDYQNGTDGTAGSSSVPWKTMEYAFDMSADGDEIVLKKGTHTVNSILTLTKALRVHGEGAKEETVIDANYGGDPYAKEKTYWRFVVSAAGADVSNVTFTRFGCNANDQLPGFICLYGDSVISNVVVTDCGYNTVYSGHIVDLKAGLFTHSWVTNNFAGDCAGVQMTGTSTMENCAILGNRCLDAAYVDGAALAFPGGSGRRTVRNCTISGNTFAHTNNAAVYGYVVVNSGSVNFYNNIVWGNVCTSAGAQHVNAHNGAATRKWFVKNNCWDYDRADRLQDPTNGTHVCSVLADPKFDTEKGGAPFILRSSPCKNAGDNNYAPTGVDILGKPRRILGHVDIGAVEFDAYAGSQLILR